MNKTWIKSNHFIQITFLSLYIVIAHYILPTFNSGKDFSFFYCWHMFSNGPRESHNDLSFDNGKTFILRDYQKYFSQKEEDIVLLNYLVQSSKPNIKKIKDLYQDLLLRKFSHKKLELFKLEGPLYKHMFEKRVPKIIETKIIYNE